MKQKKLIWYYEQLADASLGSVRLAVLSTLPLTQVQNENYFLHLDFLLALAELRNIIRCQTHASSFWLHTRRHSLFSADFLAAILADPPSQGRLATDLRIPPSLLKVVPTWRSHFLSSRMRQICMYFALRVMSYQGICSLHPTSANDPVPQIRAGTMLEIWHCVRAQLLADRPVSDVLTPISLRRSSSWRYGPAQDGYEAYQDDPKETASIFQKSSPLSNSENNEGCEADESALTAATQSEELFEWPSDDVRYKALSSTLSGVLDPELKASTLPKSNWKFCLRGILRSHYQDIFNGEQKDANDNHFWTMLFIGPLNPEWKIEDEKVLRYRFSWILEYIRTLWEESALRFKFMVDPVVASGPLPLDPALTAQPATLSGPTGTEQDKETAHGKNVCAAAWRIEREMHLTQLVRHMIGAVLGIGGRNVACFWCQVCVSDGELRTRIGASHWTDFQQSSMGCLAHSFVFCWHITAHAEAAFGTEFLSSISTYL
ncbi:hypothetical protein E0Z10_g4330 [Xylaria hypoxylon]|uniref:Uncharacterized protein n=1 Tax=Xylaria hypoxylon TaxID=37992 RepID=A0A4Z0YWY0_9PEZI|nr:hypothetical protein E0Z10_g4330 [Xylaria hypoxylon]